MALTPWQNSEVEVKVFDREGKLLTFRFKRIMIEYADLLCDGMPEKDIELELGLKPTDISDFKRRYGNFVDYIGLRGQARLFTRSLDNDFIYGLLGNAAMGKIELNSNQLNAIKLLMQAKGIANAGNGRPYAKKDEVKNDFEVREADGGKGD